GSFAARASELVRKAEQLATGSVDAREAGTASSEGAAPRLSPEAATVGESIEAMLGGLRPAFQVQHERLVEEVRFFQSSVTGALRHIEEGLKDGIVTLHTIPRVVTAVDCLHATSRRLAWQLASAFGATSGVARSYANSLALNLASTTLGGASYWGPLARYDWATGDKLDEQGIVARKEA